MNRPTAIRCFCKQLLTWLPLVLLPSAAYCFTPDDWPRWVFMWLLAGAIFAGCKWLTWSSTPGASLRRMRDWGYLLAWPGLDAPSFLRPESRGCVSRPRWSEWAWAIVKLFAGVSLFLIAAGEAKRLDERLVPPYDLALGWLAMTALVLCLHCGMFHVLSCGWRSAGVDARLLMDCPLLASSLSDFWSRRWNTAFRDLAHRFVFAPMQRRCGPRWALAVGFLFSGLVHDAVISLPSGGGYGGPTLFFALQGAGLLAQRHSRRPMRESAATQGAWKSVRRRALTLFVLVLPVGFLFHPWFVRGIVLAMLRDVAELF